jgi:hypothetical protein
MGMIEDTLEGLDDVENFEDFFLDNLPPHLQSHMPELPSTTLCALLESIHKRIEHLETKFKY